MAEQLSYLSDQERLSIYNTIVDGCQHLWSKGKLQEQKLKEVLDKFIELGESDPFFLVHFTSYAAKNLDSKDLKIVSIFANSLSSADGTPFSQGSAYKKPNFRIVSQAALQDLDSKLVSRIIEIANVKQSLGKKYKEGTHFSRSLKTAVRKYLKYREMNPKALEGVRKVGLSKTYQTLYKSLHLAPSIEAAAILGWKQKKGEKIKKVKFFDFKGLSDLEIAERIRKEKLPPTGVLGALEKKISPVIAVAILEQATGDQAVILRELFDSQGLLKNKQVMEVFTNKIQDAKTALDRVEKINTEVDEEVTKVLKKAKADKRKQSVGDIGRIFLHIDISGSMSGTIEFAKEKGSIIAECVKNPQDNFFWGLFNSQGYLMKKPDTFEKDAFAALLFGIRAGGGTNCFACFEYARKQGCDIDFYVTDQDPDSHTATKVKILENFKNAGVAMPKAVVIVDISNKKCTSLADAFNQVGVPVTTMKPNSLTESALVAQAVRTATLGPVSIIEEIMNTPLLKLPVWWESAK
ncbi:MAG TPA: hypothetical protein P5136_00915 [Methanofastidiosum sp.]|nr:hypothetical protein [Methanofastidiosum sp.]